MYRMATIFTLIESRNEKHIISELRRFIDQIDDIHTTDNLNDPVDEYDAGMEFPPDLEEIECTPLMFAIALGLDQVVQYMLDMPEMTIERITRTTICRLALDQSDEPDEDDIDALLIAMKYITRLSVFTVIRLINKIPSQHIPSYFINHAYFQYYEKGFLGFGPEWVAEIKIVLLELLKRMDYNPISGFDILTKQTTQYDQNLRLRFLYHPHVTKHISQIFVDPSSHPDGLSHLNTIYTFIATNPDGGIQIVNKILAMYPETKNVSPLVHVELIKKYKDEREQYYQQKNKERKEKCPDTQCPVSGGRRQTKSLSSQQKQKKTKRLVKSSCRSKLNCKKLMK